MVNLQAQLAYLKEQADPNCFNASTNENPTENYFEKPTSFFPQDLQSWFQVENSNLGPEFLANLSNNSTATQYYANNTDLMDLNPIENNYENSGTMEESSSFSSFDESSNTMSYDMQTNRRKWAFHEVDDLHSVAFGYSRSSAS